MASELFRNGTIIAASPGKSKIGNVQLEGLLSEMQFGGTTIFDARPAIFFEFGHIPGAESLPKDDFESAFAQSSLGKRLAEGGKVFVYCGGGDCEDSDHLAKMLVARGFRVEIFTGGWEAWEEAGLPVEKGKLR